MKKLLLGLGTLATITAPVAAVVACGTSHGGDLGGATVKPKTAQINKMLSGAVGAYEAWDLTSGDIALAVENTKTNGILKNIDFSTNPNEVIAKGATPVKTISFTKKDVIDAEKVQGGESKFEQIASDIATVTKTGNYTAKITEVRKDEVAKNNGEWKIEIFSKASNKALLQTAVDAFNDKSKFNFDEDHIKSIHGTYLYGADHSYTIDGGRSIFGTKISIKSPILATNFHDRIDQDHLKSWTMFGPAEGSKIDDVKASFKDGSKSISLAHAYYLKDRKTGKFNLVLKVVEKDGKNVIDTQTVFIEADIMTSFSDTKFVEKDFKDIMTNYISFTPVYNFFNTLKSSADSLKAGMEPLKDIVMSLSSKINLLAKSYLFSNTTDFLKDFEDYLNKQGVDMGNMLQGLKDYAELVKDKTAMFSYGAHAWNGISWAGEILTKMSDFITANIQGTSPKYTLATVKNADALQALLAAAANKQKRVDAAKQFLDNHKPTPITYKDMSDDDILQLVEDTKTSDFQSKITAMGGKVTTFKTKFDTLDDQMVSKSTQWGPYYYPSPKAIALAKFIADNWDTVVSDKTININALVYLPGWPTGENHLKSLAKYQSDHSYDHKQPTSGTSAQSLVNMLKSSMTPGGFDELSITVLKPLGLIA